ncbi:hypothetical protein QBC47DRAFT_179196 [Echria macrotheca]|uniref:Uncharacterized protein n=1 Tax=Echria macrotheca TaxID=438768 RepID=A0AAJ0BD23_9PEZI|nr:hypothetical protein QBC47DRAFT_179196 [Echria macrotheca]
MSHTWTAGRGATTSDHQGCTDGAGFLEGSAAERSGNKHRTGKGDKDIVILRSGGALEHRGRGQDPEGGKADKGQQDDTVSGGQDIEKGDVKTRLDRLYARLRGDELDVENCRPPQTVASCVVSGRCQRMACCWKSDSCLHVCSHRVSLKTSSMNAPAGGVGSVGLEGLGIAVVEGRESGVNEGKDAKGKSARVCLYVTAHAVVGP